SALLFAGLCMPGCDYEDTKPCALDSDCAPGFVCDEEACRKSFVRKCTKPRDCSFNETCGKNGTCQVGDCTWEDIGCVEGYACAAREGVWQCVAAANGQGGEGGAGGTDAGAGAGGAGDAGAADG